MPTFKHNYDWSDATISVIIECPDSDYVTVDTIPVSQCNPVEHDELTIDVVQLNGKKTPFYTLPDKLRKEIQFDFGKWLKEYNDSVKYGY